jgi:hypothetical protein
MHLKSKTVPFIALWMAVFVGPIIWYLYGVQTDATFVEQHRHTPIGYMCLYESGRPAFRTKVPAGGTDVTSGVLSSGSSPSCQPVDAQGNLLDLFCAPNHSRTYLDVWTASGEVRRAVYGCTANLAHKD